MSQQPFTPLFTKHSRSWRENRYVYPVISRRSNGLSVGVNLNPDKVCNFDCVYCCVDRATMPGKVNVDLDILKAELEHMLQLVATGELWKQPPFDQTPETLKRLNDVAFSGDGEPTSFLKFEEVCRLSSDVLKQLNLAAKLVVITNATLFHQPRVKQALSYLDTVSSELWSKLDAGTQAYYQTVERTSVPLERVMQNLLEAGQVRPIVIQSLFMKLKGEAVPDSEIAAYVDRLRQLQTGGCQIKLVQVYTVARGPAEQYVSPLDRSQVDAIVEKVKTLGLNVQGYYGPA
jgi:wyosine [tRNA(Phe)-imidazoG37] synthetase (radical SAM superfamily)